MKRLILIMIVLPILILAGEWTLTGSLNHPRNSHQVALLPDGRVLIAGGWKHGGGSGPTSSCEIWDSETGEWTEIESMQIPRTDFVIIKLDNGNFLAIGGFNYIEGRLNSCEIYDPEIGEWSETGSMNNARSCHAAILLSNGRALVAGGFDGGDRNSCEIYDPEIGEWSYTGFLNEGRLYHTLTRLPDNTILTAGDSNSPTCEIYDPETEQWIYTDSLNQQREYHTATMLLDGKILVVGGVGPGDNFLSSSEIYDSETEEWTYTDSLEIGRCVHTATLLPNGKILVNGGFNPDPPPNPVKISTEVYNPLTGLWQEDADMNLGRDNHTSTLLLDGRVLAAGSGGVMPQTELYSWNYQPQVSQLQGPSQGLVGDTLFFSVSVSDIDNDSVSVRFSWSDGDTTNWSAYQPSGAEFVFSHVFSDSGEYLIQAQARDIWQPQGIHNSLGEWSEPLVVIISDTTVGIDPESPPVPLTLALSQNYPNPFNQSTIISYQLPMNGSVELIIYNLMGQKVKTLTTGFQRAGDYSLIWDSRDKYNQEVPSGIYVYCLTTPDRIISRKMILVK